MDTDREPEEIETLDLDEVARLYGPNIRELCEKAITVGMCLATNSIKRGVELAEIAAEQGGNLAALAIADGCNRKLDL